MMRGTIERWIPKGKRTEKGGGMVRDGVMGTHEVRGRKDTNLGLVAFFFTRSPKTTY